MATIKKMSLERADYLANTLTAFDSFFDLLNAEGGYRPSLICNNPKAKELADLYDFAQEVRGDYRRAYRS